MKKYLLILFLGLSFFNCKKEVPETLTTYQYPNRPQTLDCKYSLDTKLYTEAYYIFIDAIKKHAIENNKLPIKITTGFALKNFIGHAKYNIKIEEYLNDDVIRVFKHLEKQNLWENKRLKNNTPFIECIQKSIIDDDVRKTFKSLRDTNSLTPKLMANAIYGTHKALGKLSDKALMTYVAIDMFYSKIHEIDVSEIDNIENKN